MYIAICDDCPNEIHTLTESINHWHTMHHSLPLNYKTFHNATSLLDAAEREFFTTYFLDVMMPGMDGLAIAREIRHFDETANIIFLTSSPDFAYESYSVRALDYLLKPVSEEKLFSLLNELSYKEQKNYEVLTLKQGSTLFRIPFSRIIYVEVNKKHLYFTMTDGSVQRVFGTLKEYESQLFARPEFMRIHRSYIVNMTHVAQLSPTSIRTFAGNNLPVSRLLYPQLQKDYMKLLFEQREDSCNDTF